MIKEDCFAWQPGRKQCKALIRVLCRKGDCPFYKTKEQYARDFPDTIPLAQRPVIRIDDGKYYPTATIAAQDTEITLSMLLNHLRGDYPTASGYHWRWATAKEVKKYANSYSN